MKESIEFRDGEKKSHFIYKDGKLHFSKELERKVFFFMTIIMLLAGLFVKAGVF